ncbi:KinB-signaling pathway activation protein [Brevibacillus migulae]|uniref:KinB-signaling pathway activation protein n=1 Tax=Brevibacillus migulae TaxID=1644114 RepID=UPI00106ED5F5|nr:KinB-signaling pathway activation protein [Brevibacillus migulae]
MNLRKFGWLFMTTLLIGGAGGVLSGFLIAWTELTKSTMGNFFMGTLANLLFGATISIVAQMGLFAYMTFNYMMLSIFRGGVLWRNIQVFFILFTFFDMAYLRYNTLSRGESLWPYLIEPVGLLIAAIVFAYVKVKLTNPTAWVPTIFFLFVVTALEWIPGLKEQHASSIISFIIPLMACNVWQVLHLHRLTKKES